MDYLTLKHVHMTCAALSGAFFVLRGVWMVRESPMLQQRWVRIAPHIVDSALLVTALIMVFWSGQYPFVQGWLTAKVVALVIYIILGTIALKRGKTRKVRIFAFVAAIATFAYIGLVATTRHALLYA